MLFITNRRLKQGPKSKANRKVDFDLKNNESQQSLFFCERTAQGAYVELVSPGFLERLRKSEKEQVLIFIDG
jgi:hypothetical protein